MSITFNNPPIYILYICFGSLGVVCLCWHYIKGLTIYFKSLLTERTDEQEYNSYTTENEENNIDLEVAEITERTNSRVNFGIKNKQTKKLKKNTNANNDNNDNNDNDDNHDNDLDLPSYSEVFKGNP